MCICMINDARVTKFNLQAAFDQSLRQWTLGIAVYLCYKTQLY